MNKGKSKTLLISVAAAVVVLIAALLCLPRCGKQEDSWQNQYDLGVRLLNEGNYEEAILAFKNVIEIDPKKADGYIGLADVYLAMEEPQSAVDVLTQGLAAVDQASEKTKLENKLDEINREYFPENAETGGAVNTETSESGGQGNLSGSTDGNDSSSDPVITAMEETIAAQYDYAGPFSEGLAMVGLLGEDDTMKYFFIDTAGNVVSDQYDYAADFCEGRAVVGKNQGDGTILFGYIDAQGNEVIPLQYAGSEWLGIVCSSFYDGVAEVIWLDDIYGYYIFINIIDKDGNKLLPDHMDFIDDIYGYEYPEDPRLLSMTRESLTGASWMVNPVQIARCCGGKFPVSIYDGVKSYWIDENLQVIGSREEYAVDVGSGYVMYQDMNHISIVNDGILVDCKGNVILDNFNTMYSGVNGQMIATVAEIGAYGMPTGYYQAIYSPEGQLLSSGYVSAETCGPGYLVSYEEMDPSGNRKRIYLDENLNEVFSCETCSMYALGFSDDAVLLYDGYYDASNTYRTRYRSVKGEILFEESDDSSVRLLSEDYVAVCWADRSVIYSVDGREITEFAGLTDMQMWFEDIAGCETTVSGIDANGELVYMGFNTVDGELVVTKLAVNEESYTFYVPGEDTLVLRESGQAALVGSSDYRAVLTLMQGDTVLYEGTAASLIANNLYKTAETVYWDEMSYGYVVSDITLHTVDGSWSSETYDEMGVLSENFISVCRDGKWGYLSVK